MANNFYRRTTGLGNFYSVGSSGTEPNIREELIRTLDGYYPEIAKGQTGMLRRLRRDDDNALIPCECVDLVTGEPDRDRFCPICFGEGYLFDEEFINFYVMYEGSDVLNAQKDIQTKPGLINQPFVVFYVRYSAEITKQDKIVEVELEPDGTVSEPMRRRHVFRISRVWAYRADNGKLEYYKVFGYLDNTKYLNAPSYGE